MTADPVPSRPVPEPSELTTEFWAAARREVLVRPVCSQCGKNFFTPQVACPVCLSEDWTYQPSCGRGVVYSATVVHRPPFPGLETPYQLAIVDLEENWSMLTNIVGTGAPATPIGTPVEVTWLPLNELIVLPVFRVRVDGAQP